MTKKPLAVDLFCGRGGWTKGLLAAGFDVVGIDNEPQPAYPDAARFIQADIRDVSGADFAGAAVVVASPPCTGFSRLNYLNPKTVGVRPRPIDFELVAHALRVIGETQAALWAVENVDGAIAWFEPILGRPRAAIKPYWLWGQFPGFLLPTSAPVKVKTGRVGGIQRPDGTWDRDNDNRRLTARRWNGKSKEQVAKVAEIPEALARPFAEACMAALFAEVVSSA